MRDSLNYQPFVLRIVRAAALLADCGASREGEYFSPDGVSALVKAWKLGSIGVAKPLQSLSTRPAPLAG